MSAPTATMQRGDVTAIPIKRRGSRVALIGGILIASATVTFALVSAMSGRHHAAEPSPGSGSSVALGTVPPDAAVHPTPADAAAPLPTPPDAAIAAIVDAGVADATVASVGPSPDVKKDASSHQGAHPVADKKLGKLHAIGDPIRTVYADGKLLGDMPLDRALPVGRHSIRLVNPDTGLDERLSITITENATTTIDRTH